MKIKTLHEIHTEGILHEISCEIKEMKKKKLI